MNGLRRYRGSTLSRCVLCYCSSSSWPRFTSAMGKSTTRNGALAKQSKEKLKKEYHSGSIILKVIGSGTEGAPRSLTVETDRRNYLFNCGEGTQKAASEYKARLPKMQNIFITAPNWRNLGGLPGLLLSMQTMGMVNLLIHGPEGTRDVLNAVRQFVYLDTLDVRQANITTRTDHSDSIMDILSIKISKGKDPVVGRSTSNGCDEGSVKSPKRNTDRGDRSPPRKIQKRANAHVEDLKFSETIERITDIACYVCKLKDTLGKLDLQKCVDRGVPPGPILGQLKEGNDVTLPDGTVVYSKDVCSPPTPGAHFIVIECPTEAYLDGVLGNEAFKPYQTESSTEYKQLHCVVHFTEKPIIDHPRYRDWMKGFGPHTYHLLVNENNRCHGTEAVYRNQYRLHTIEPNIYPLLPDPAIGPSSNVLQTDTVPRIVPGKTMTMILMKPNRGVSTDGVIPSVNDLYELEAKEIANLDTSTLDKIRREIEQEAKTLEDAPEYPKVVMLGTGSSMPTKSRNTSGILLRIDPENSVILDCGEDTYGQLYRFYGGDRVKEILATVKMIYVSHLHADHHLGLVMLILKLYAVNKEPVVLLLPEGLPKWLSYYDKRFEDLCMMYCAYVNNSLLRDQDRLYPMPPSDIERIFAPLGIRDIETKKVDHCAYAYGVSMTLLDGTKVVYSGDTRPCQAMVELGKDCDLLIHEATMEDGLEDRAVQKMHSTISQAIDIGRRMNAKNILLTHFSQRYSKLPFLPDSKTGWNNVAVAYDCMEFSLSRFKLLVMMSPAYEILYGDFKEQLQGKANKRMEKESKQQEPIAIAMNSL